MMKAKKRVSSQNEKKRKEKLKWTKISKKLWDCYNNVEKIQNVFFDEYED